MEQEFIPLTEDQLIAAEKGELKLKLRNGVKVTQLMWCRTPYDQSRNNVLIILSVDGRRRNHYKDGRHTYEIGNEYDLFFDEEETAKLNKQEHQMHSVIDDSQYTRLLIGVNTPIPSEQAFGGFDQNTSSHIINNNVMNPLLAHTLEQLNKPNANAAYVIGSAFMELLEQRNENQELNLCGGESVDENTAVHRSKNFFHDETPQPKHKCSYKGQLTDVPDKVVHLMLKRQVEQGNKEDVSVFEKNKRLGKLYGGIDWSRTPEGHEYWYKVIDECNYDIVPDEPEQPIYQVGEIIEIEECGFWVIAEHRDTKNGIVVVWLNGGYHQITDGLHRKKQNNRTVDIDGKTMTVTEAKNYLDTLIEKQLDFPEKRVSNGGI